MREPKPLQPGDEAPPFRMEDEQGRNIDLYDFRGVRMVLYFYAHDGNSGCLAQALAYRNHYARIRELGAVVLGVSPDSRDSHARFKEEHALPFTLLSDPGGEVARAYCCWGERVILGNSFVGVIRSHFVIEQNGFVVEARVPVGASDSPQLAVDCLIRHDQL